MNFKVIVNFHIFKIFKNFQKGISQLDKGRKVKKLNFKLTVNFKSVIFSIFIAYFLSIYSNFN